MLASFARLLTPATMSFGMGLQQTATQLGLAVSPYLAGLLYAYNPSWPFYAGLLALAVTLTATALLPQATSSDSKAVKQWDSQAVGQ
jgi:MFS family permease